MRTQKNWDGEQTHALLLQLFCVFLILQPVFDVLSQMDVRGYLPFGISTYIKPLFAGFLNIALLLLYKKEFGRCAVTYSLFAVLAIVHSVLMYGLQIDLSVISHEIRFMINLLYMLILYQDLRILYRYASNPKGYADRLTKALLICFGLYLGLYLLAVVSGTSGMTYEYADATKLGFKGWFHSGQIFGHALCICMPLLVCVLLNNNCQNPLLRILGKLCITIPVLVLCLIGTKVSFYIPIIVLGAQVVLELFFAIRGKDRSHVFNALLCAACVVVCLLAYPYTAVYHNTQVNDLTLADKYDAQELETFIESEREKHLSHNWGDRNWTEKALSVLEGKFRSEELHPSQMRNRQLCFTSVKFMEAPLFYKLFGIGYLNQLDMAIERDVMCALFCFGIFGFLFCLCVPIYHWLQAAFVILKRLFKADIKTLCLFEGLSMFFFISWYAGATFIYTQFSIFLMVVICLLKQHIGALNDQH